MRQAKFPLVGKKEFRTRVVIWVFLTLFCVATWAAVFVIAWEHM